MFLKSISNFRGMAIIAIVAGHLNSSGFTSNDLISSTIRNMIIGGSSLFVFISGFMFYHVFYKRYNYKKFITGKIKNLGVPYLILATIAIAHLFVFKLEYYTPIESMRNAAEAFRHGILFSPDDSHLMTTVKYYLTGRFLTAYWYIPFGLLLFASAPLHFRFANLSTKIQIAIIVGLSIVAIFVQRPVAGTNALHSLVYYTPVYLMGIAFSMHREPINRFLNNKLPILFLFIVLISVYQVTYAHEGNYEKPFFEYGGVDLQFIKCLFTIWFLYGLFEKYTFDLPMLNVISETSFAIYFIHPWVMMIIYRIDNKIHHLQPSGAENNIPMYLFTLIAVMAISVAIALTTKYVFRGSRNTRYLIGY